jgi:predicted DNA-binding transcriptional regulator YafY
MSANALLAHTRRQRILEMLRPGQDKGISLSDIHKRVNVELELGGNPHVDRKTISRDLGILMGAHASIRSGTTKAHAQRLVFYFDERGYRCYNKMSLTEAMGLVMMKDMVGHMMPAFIREATDLRLREAEASLEAAPRRGAVAWRDKLRAVSGVYELQPPRIGQEIASTIQQALLEYRQIQAVYKPRKQPSSERTLHPFGLLQIGNVVHLVAFDPTKERDPMRQYALHRFESVSLLEEPTRVPIGYTIKRFLATRDGRPGQLSGPMITLKAIVYGGHLDIIEETKIGERMHEKRLDDGTLLISTRVQHTWQLEHYILSVADEMQVLEPPALRELIRRRICAGARRYEESEPLTSGETAPDSP